MNHPTNTSPQPPRTHCAVLLTGACAVAAAAAPRPAAAPPRAEPDRRERAAQPGTPAEPTRKQRKQAAKLTRRLQAAIADEDYRDPKWRNMEEVAAVASSLLRRVRSADPVFRTLHLTVEASRAEERRRATQWGANRKRFDAELSAALTTAGVGALGRVRMNALADHPELVVGLVQYACRDARMFLDRGELFRACGKPADFDEHVEPLLARYGSDPDGLKDWYSLCRSIDADSRPALSPAQVLAAQTHPLGILAQFVTAEPTARWAPAAPRQLRAALDQARLSPAEVAEVQAVARETEVDPRRRRPRTVGPLQTDGRLAVNALVLTYQLALRGHYEDAARLSRRLHRGLESLVIDVARLTDLYTAWIPVRRNITD